MASEPRPQSFILARFLDTNRSSIRSKTLCDGTTFGKRSVSCRERNQAAEAALFLFSSRKIRIAPGLDSVQPGFSGSDPDRFLDVGDEDLAVADPSGLGGAADRVDRLLDQVVADYDLDFHLGQEIDDVFRAAIEFGVALLPAEALGFGDRDTLQSNFLKRLFHLVELEWLDDGFDLLH